VGAERALVLVVNSLRGSYDLPSRPAKAREPYARVRPPSRCRYKWTGSHPPSRWKQEVRKTNACREKSTLALNLCREVKIEVPLCVSLRSSAPLRLLFFTRYLPQRRRGTQRYAEKKLRQTASRLRSCTWINVSTTCGSGWVNREKQYRMLITDPPATAGGTDIYPSATQKPNAAQS